jgi:hypothetical protein
MEILILWKKFLVPSTKKTFKIDLDLMELFSRSLQFHYIEVRLQLKLKSQKFDGFALF